jgi:CubicO group peptidase (beta-lactamase class C family)
VEGAFRDIRAAEGVPGMAVGVVGRGSRSVWVDGELDRSRPGLPVTRETPFRIASITKPFTAMLALDLGLALDEPLVAALPGTTPRLLLSHSGGFASESPVPLEEFGEADDAFARYLEAAPLEPLPVAPGELSSYSNAGYRLVGAACAVAEGASFERLLGERVLGPAGLVATGFDDPGEVAARGHAGDGTPLGREPYPRARRPGGGLWSTVDDLLTFAELHLAGGGVVAAMQVATASRPGGSYGLGWMLREARGGRRCVYHSGSIAGFQSKLVLLPDEDVAFVALTNSARGSVAIERLLAERGLDAAPPAVVAVGSAELRAYEGRYASQNLAVEVRVDGDALVVDGGEVDPVSHRALVSVRSRGRPCGQGEFVVLDGDRDGERFDFPRPGLGRFGGVIAVRTER